MIKHVGVFFLLIYIHTSRIRTFNNIHIDFIRQVKQHSMKMVPCYYLTIHQDNISTIVFKRMLKNHLISSLSTCDFPNANKK